MTDQEKKTKNNLEKSSMKKSRRHKKLDIVLISFCLIALLITVGSELYSKYIVWQDNQTIEKQQKRLTQEKLENQVPKEMNHDNGGVRESKESFEDDGRQMDSLKQSALADILPEYKSLYEENKDMIGWLKIEDTTIDYPVMQTMEDEDYYLSRDFYGEKNVNGCLILDTDSNAGTGTLEKSYENGSKPSTNLIIHGHTMKSHLMFGNLNLYEDGEYGKAHSIIEFDSLYEHRKYQLIAVFYSQVYYENQDVFKYYQFFQAKDESQFNTWYQNIKSMSLYDTGVTAEFGDEFITLSCCSYQVKDGRFVVIGKKI